MKLYFPSEVIRPEVYGCDRPQVSRSRSLLSSAARGPPLPARVVALLLKAVGAGVMPQPNHPVLQCWELSLVPANWSLNFSDHVPGIPTGAGALVALATADKLPPHARHGASAIPQIARSDAVVRTPSGRVRNHALIITRSRPPSRRSYSRPACSGRCLTPRRGRRGHARRTVPSPPRRSPRPSVASRGPFGVGAWAGLSRQFLRRSSSRAHPAWGWGLIQKSSLSPPQSHPPY